MSLVDLMMVCRYTFDKAADHVYTLLLKKDCYPRFLRDGQKSDKKT
jgi:hypothetical protein